jgi:PPK2 family polyphosphate:nucleotide phosphotransferase
MDTAGKDGAIKHVMSGVNPQGCQVHTFRHPSATELEHDFLWRTTQALPERGNIGIFNRSYYEEVLIARVHPEILEAEQVHDYRSGEDVWRHRYESINDHEKHLHRSGTHVIKFFLHISKEEQRQRLLSRITKRSKNWKYNPDDLKERQYWDKYMDAYQRCLGETSTEHAPWYVVPADDKRNARLFVSNIILHTMAGLEVSLPPQTEERLKELEQGRLALEAEA